MTDETRVTSSTGGQKGKKLARYSLIPVGPLEQVAMLYGRGAEKYDDHNWRRGYDWSLSYDALLRHIQAAWGGQWLDEHEEDCEPGCVNHTEMPHLAAVIFHAMTLLEFAETHPEFDDRYVAPLVNHEEEVGIEWKDPVLPTQAAMREAYGDDVVDAMNGPSTWAHNGFAARLFRDYYDVPSIDPEVDNAFVKAFSELDDDDDGVVYATPRVPKFEKVDLAPHLEAMQESVNEMVERYRQAVPGFARDILGVRPPRIKTSIHWTGGLPEDVRDQLQRHINRDA